VEAPRGRRPPRWRSTSRWRTSPPTPSIYQALLRALNKQLRHPRHRASTKGNADGLPRRIPDRARRAWQLEKTRLDVTQHGTSPTCTPRRAPTARLFRPLRVVAQEPGDLRARKCCAACQIASVEEVDAAPRSVSSRAIPHARREGLRPYPGRGPGERDGQRMTRCAPTRRT
jgi:hypothetical protein